MAAEESPFSPVRSYEDGMFEDVTSSDWFYSSVAGAYEYGFTEGSGENVFSPYGLVSLAEVVTFAGRLNMTYTGTKTQPVAKIDEKWYEPWVEYAEENAIISKGEFEGRFEKPATRGQVAYILGNSVPFTVFENINTSVSAIPDMQNTDNYYNEVIMLYRAGVLTGKTANGSFAPTENITRAEIAAVLYRIADVSARVKVNFEYKQGIDVVTAYDAEGISELAGEAVFLVAVYDKNGNLTGTGSGFFIDESGKAVTNYHVIDGGSKVQIMTIDGETYNVETVLGFDEDRDIAVLDIEGEGFKTVKVGNSDNIKNGQKIFCIGSPIGLDNTISEGLISNISREIEGYEYIQISAPISPGSSGGAVFNTLGEVVGITAATASQGQNINLAIPINDVKNISLDVNKTTGELFGEQVTASSGTTVINPDQSAECYEGTNIPTYSYVTGTECIGISDDDDVTVYRHRYSQFGMMAYISYLGSYGWQMVNISRDGGVIAMYMTDGINVIAVAYAMPYDELWIVI